MICGVSAVVVALIVVLGLGLAGVLPGPGTWFGTGMQLVNRQAYSASQLSEVSAAYSSDSITLMASDGGEVVLEEYMSSRDADMLAVVTQESGRLDIQGGKRPLISFGFLSFRS